MQYACEDGRRLALSASPVFLKSLEKRVRSASKDTANTLSLGCVLRVPLTNFDLVVWFAKEDGAKWDEDASLVSLTSIAIDVWCANGDGKRLQEGASLAIGPASNKSARNARGDTANFHKRAFVLLAIMIDFIKDAWFAKEVTRKLDLCASVATSLIYTSHASTVKDRACFNFERTKARKGRFCLCVSLVISKCGFRIFFR